jgi:hypothetical protein
MKNRTNLILLIIIFLLGVGLIWIVKNSLEKSDTIDTVQNNLEAQRSQTEFYKDKFGNWRGKALAAEGTIEQLAITHQAEIDSIEKYFDIKIKNLQSSGSVGTQTSIDVKIPLQKGNTMPILTQKGEKSENKDENGNIIPNPRPFKLETKWYNISGFVYPNDIDLSINVFDSISIVSYWERERFWKPKKFKTEAISYNPYTKVKFVNSMDVNRGRKPKWVVAPFIGYGMGVGFQPQPFIGIGVGYKLFEF